MGGNWSQAESWYTIATKDEVSGAMKGFHEWEKVQAELNASRVLKPALPTTGPLLDRLGGPDAAKRLAEAFCRKLYADKRLQEFMVGRDIIYMRAKLSAFATWLFSPAHKPYPGRHLRSAHLRLIKQRGLTEEDFEQALGYFAEAVRELDVPEELVNEVMAKLRPYKRVVFTPNPRDKDDEARWAMEERAKQLQQLRAQHEQQRKEQEQKEQEQKEQQGGGCPHLRGQSQRRSVDEPQRPLLLEAPPPNAGQQPAAAAAAGGEHGSGSRPGSGAAATSAEVAQCPFPHARVPLPRSISANASQMPHAGEPERHGPAAGHIPTSSSSFTSAIPAPPLHRVSPSPSAALPSRAMPMATAVIPALRPGTSGPAGTAPPPSLAALPPGLAGLPPPPALRPMPAARPSHTPSGNATPRSTVLGTFSAGSREQSVAAGSVNNSGVATPVHALESPAKMKAA